MDCTIEDQYYEQDLQQFPTGGNEDPLEYEEAFATEESKDDDSIESHATPPQLINSEHELPIPPQEATCYVCLSKPGKN